MVKNNKVFIHPYNTNSLNWPKRKQICAKVYYYNAIKQFSTFLLAIYLNIVKQFRNKNKRFIYYVSIIYDS